MTHQERNLPEIVARWSDKILKELEQLLPTNPSEADFRAPIDNLLSAFCQEIGLNPLLQREYTLADGRADTVFNRFIIEYERPGKLKKNPDQATRTSIEQVKTYLKGFAQKTRHHQDRLAGVCFDGYFLIFIRYINDSWVVEPPVEVNRHSLARLLTWLAGLASGIALTAENLNRDFSIEQLRTQTILRSLFRALQDALQNPNSLVAKLFEQWRLFFSEAIDYSEAFGGRKLEPLQKWVRKAGIDIHSPVEAERFFFALHTYFALLVKLLAWLAVSRHIGVKLGAPTFSKLVTADSQTLQRYLLDMESGGIFRQYGISNLLEGDFFSWYLHAWNADIENALRQLIQRLDEYDPTTLSLLPEETRDLFKKLYHYLLPREIRHNLGEYYTPDWLARRLLNQIDNSFFLGDPNRTPQLRTKLLNTRFLDPACGSGTFLVLIIARMRELARALMVPEKELLDALLHNVVGFDINPLAVLTARVNYLLAIADLLEHRTDELTLPIYLADSVRMPAQGEDLYSHDTYEFPTAVGTFRVPALLCTKERFDPFTTQLDEAVHREETPQAFLHRIQNLLTHNGTVDPQAQTLVQTLYERLLSLHQQGLNGLWARLLKNNFAPLTVGQFDSIVGNPPWINWEHLPDEYRDSIKHLWLHYRLAGTFQGGRPRLGNVKVDISALMTYVVMDYLLKEGGRLGFVVTQSLLKTAGAGAGFRRLKLPQKNGTEMPLRVVYVDDMVDLNPFEGASNRTAVIIIEKGKPTQYPVSYTVWRKRKGARFHYDSTLEEVTDATQRLNFYAEPVDPKDPTSPWLTARKQALQVVRKVLGRSDYEAHAGTYTGGSNGVYWVEQVYTRPDGLVVVRNLTEGAKVKVPEVTETIEPDLLYPLLRGRDVGRWRAEPEAWIIVPQDPNQPNRAYPETTLQRDYPRTYGYLRRFEDLLRKRSGYVQILSKREKEFYGLMDIDRYTFAPWKVVWREQASRMTASVVGATKGKTIIADHKLMLVDCADEEEAHYVCGLLNSSVVAMVVLGYAVSIQMDPHILENIRIPRYNSSDSVHRQLAALSQQAHALAQQDAPDALQAVEQQIDHLAARLWGLTDSELKEIQQSLRELGG